MIREPGVGTKVNIAPKMVAHFEHDPGLLVFLTTPAMAAGGLPGAHAARVCKRCHLVYLEVDDELDDWVTEEGGG